MIDDLRITVDELQERVEAGDEFTFVDTRNPQVWVQAREILPHAIRIPVDDLDKNVARIPKNKPIVAYCT